jgi:CheY-like chemotaxis protein
MTQAPLQTLDDHPFSGKMVLVVDDDTRNAFALSALLERGHANIVVVESGPDAIDVLARASQTDIVLLDIAMPVMDGYQTMRAIRTQERFKLLPIIAVTGRDNGERQRCLDAGANDFLPKPVATADLLTVVAPWLTTSRSSSD